MKPRCYNYFDLRSKQSHASCAFEFTSLEELKRFADAMQSKNIYVLTGEDGTPERFAVIDNGIMLHHSSLQYKTLEDYQAAKQANFPDAITFYTAKASGYNKYEDYKLVLEAGISDIKVFEKLKSGGYIAGFKEYADILASGVSLPATEPLLTAFELYTYAINNGFENYSQFKEAFTKGFTNLAVYKVAVEHGFPTFADYEDGRSRGFREYAHLKFANENLVRDDADLRRMLDLGIVICDDCTCDQKVMINLLSKLEQGKKVSINKLTDLFQKTLDEYLYPDNNQMPAWFTYAFSGTESIIEFLQKNLQAKKYGGYDIDGEFFQVNFWQNRSVVIDASNVAHNSCGNGASKAKAGNIIKLVEFLKHKGFNEMHVIADASLKHKITDTENMTALKSATQYVEAPGGTSADAFIIEFVKRHNCLLISNDTFREWKMKDPWVAQNIDFYRLSFLIKENDVLMPDLN
jgi:hypothetical protein